MACHLGAIHVDRNYSCNASDLFSCWLAWVFRNFFVVWIVLVFHVSLYLQKPRN